jgi:endonuclease/exonuclease/phosphatase family metal-dependent hydrolase
VRLRVATYNVRSFRSGVDSVARAFEPLEADIAMLQECGSKRVLRRFARAVNMTFSSSHRPFNRVRNAVLYRSEWRPARVDVRDFSREGRTLRRGLVAVRLRRRGAGLTAVSAHLGLAPGERGRHARELTDHLAGVNGPLVLGADLNEGPDGPAAGWISERLFDLATAGGEGSDETFPAPAPTARIDYLFATAEVKVAAAWVPSGRDMSGASDHLPVVAEVEIEG